MIQKTKEIMMKADLATLKIFNSEYYQKTKYPAPYEWMYNVTEVKTSGDVVEIYYRLVNDRGNLRPIDDVRGSGVRKYNVKWIEKIEMSVTERKW
jgi:hypothetical protein